MRRIRFRVHYRPHNITVLILILSLPIGGIFLAHTVRRVSAESVQIPLLQRASPLRMRRFYATKNSVSADQALTACASGYHMASLWEIANPSNFKYDTTLGVTSPDSGQGPPTSTPFLGGSLMVRGWVRTGYINSVTATAGLGNCNGWSSTSDTHSGTAIRLPSVWTSSPDIGVWDAAAASCDIPRRVWCVQDEPESVFLPIILK
jgi:hypothetical protein